MRISKPLAAMATVTLLAAAAVAAVAGPAAANDQSPLQAGSILWFNQVGPLASQTPATQIFGGTDASVVGAWKTLTTSQPCPAGSKQLTTFIRIPQGGVAEDLWEEVQLGGNVTVQDAAGLFYSSVPTQADRISKPQVMAYQAAHPGANQFPIVAVCGDADGFTTGSFRNVVTITGTTSATLAWTIDSTPIPGGGGGATVTDTATTLTGAISGTDLVLTAAVSPAAAAGTVTFKEGTTVLGTGTGTVATYTVTAPLPGAHSFTAEFAPTDATKFKASTGGPLGVTIGIDTKTGQLALTVPAAPPVPDGSLVFTVPFNSPVALTGARAADNSRITAPGAFPTVTVTDTRRDALLAGWEVNAQASDFTGTAGTIGAKYLGWSPATPTLTPDVAGGPLMAQAGPPVTSNLDGGNGLAVSSLLGKSTTNGRGATVLGAALNLAIPASSPAGTYSSTVTVTLVAN
jgi:hypothetical protein